MDVFDLEAKIRLDASEYEDGVGKAKGTFSSLASGVKTGLATVAKIGGAAITAGAAGVTALTKMGIEGYKQYEQLAGGAKLLWGEAYDVIAEKAAGAYATVQMSQSDYLEQVNGLAVGLKTALGGNAQAAAELAHNVVQAEADIVAATGAAQENVQNAFNGIMKGNFSMVDNLGLGITATKEGFQAMIDSVNAYNAAHGKSTQYTIDNVADCQQALVDYVAMQGMAGYAGMEAAESLEGSLAMTKAAWQNLVTGLADPNADIGVLIDNMVTSAGAAAKQLIPVVTQSLSGIGQLVEGLAPVISSALPTMVESVLPSLLNAAVTLVTSVFGALPGLIGSMLPVVIQSALDVLTAFCGVINENSGTLLQIGVDALLQIITGITSCLPQIIETAMVVIMSLVSTLTDPSNLQQMLNAAMVLIESIVTGLINNLPQLVNAAILLVQNLVTFITQPGNLAKLLSMCVKMVTTIVNGLVSAIPQLVQAAIQLVTSLVQYLLLPSNITLLINMALQIVQAIATGLVQASVELVNGATTLIVELCDTFINTDWASIGESIINGLLDGLKLAWETVSSWFSGVWSALFDRDVSVSADKNGNVKAQGHATGLNYVPYDDYPALLHRGEAVLTSMEATEWRNGKNKNVVSIQRIGMEKTTDTQNERIVSLLSDLLSAIVDGNEEMTRAIMADKKIAVGEREFARLVKTYA